MLTYLVMTSMNEANLGMVNLGITSEKCQISFFHDKGKLNPNTLAHTNPINWVFDRFLEAYLVINLLQKNFYVLKIYLNLFEISKQVFKFENLISHLKKYYPVWKVVSNMNRKSGSMCVLSHDKLEYTWQHFIGSMFESNFQTG